MNTARQRWTFISYSRKDGDFALALARALKSAGYAVWLDQLDIPTGARWDDEVERALHECDIFLIILTPDSVSSENVKDEIGYAIDYGKRILPVLLEECTVPLRLRRFQRVDFTKMEFSEGVKRAEQLLESFLHEGPAPGAVSKPEPEPQIIPQRVTAPAPPVSAPAKPVRRRWVGGGAGTLAAVLCIAALGAIVLFGDRLSQLVNGPGSQPPPIITETKNPTSTPTRRPPTRTPRPTSTPAPAPMTGEVLVDAEGYISPGFGNQWEFLPASSQILVNIDLAEIADDCPIEVWVVDTNANQILFTETISPGSLTYNAYFTVEPGKSHTVVVGANDRSRGIVGCTGTEEFSFQIKVLS